MVAIRDRDSDSSGLAAIFAVLITADELPGWLDT
jgi:hypothetical protein